MPGIKKLKKARFALPSLVTFGSVFCAFLSMSFVLQAHNQVGSTRLDLLCNAALAILGSIVFDLFDGKVARWTKTSTKFGMELDSLSDCVSFGIAPALLLYGFALNQAGWFGLIAAFLYACGAIIRLARFNIEAPDEGVQTYFKGIPSPAGAAGISAIVLAAIETNLVQFTKFELNTLGVVAIAIGLLMVSNVKYKTMKGKKTKGDIAFVIIGLALFGGTWAYYHSGAIAFFLLVCYFYAYGMLLTIYINLRKTPRRRKFRSRKSPNAKPSPDTTENNTTNNNDNAGDDKNNNNDNAGDDKNNNNDKAGNDKNNGETH